MAIKKLHVGIGPRRQRRNPPFPSEPGYIEFMRESAQEMMNALLSVLDQFEDVSPDVMLEALEPVQKRAEYLCPKDTHELVESSYLKVAKFRGQQRVEIGFGLAGKPNYAIYVHEILDYKHEEPTQAKFLETAVMEDLDGVYTRLAAGYNQFMRGGGR